MKYQKTRKYSKKIFKIACIIKNDSVKKSRLR
jgi:hypothetical protein